MDYFKLALELGNKLMDQFPDYDQRKKSDFHKLKTQYNDEITKRYPVRDDDLIMNLREDLANLLESFYKEIKQ